MVAPPHSLRMGRRFGPITVANASTSSLTAQAIQQALVSWASSRPEEPGGSPTNVAGLLNGQSGSLISSRRPKSRRSLASPQQSIERPTKLLFIRPALRMRRPAAGVVLAAGVDEAEAAGAIEHPGHRGPGG